MFKFLKVVILTIVGAIYLGWAFYYSFEVAIPQYDKKNHNAYTLASQQIPSIEDIYPDIRLYFERPEAYAEYLWKYNRLSQSEYDLALFRSKIYSCLVKYLDAAENSRMICDRETKKIITANLKINLSALKERDTQMTLLIIGSTLFWGAVSGVVILFILSLTIGLISWPIVALKEALEIRLFPSHKIPRAFDAKALRKIPSTSKIELK